MTDDQLMSAIDTYTMIAAHEARKHGPAADLTDYRADLFAALEKWSDHRCAVQALTLADAQAELAVYDGLVHGLKLLRAKAAVCDAVLASDVDLPCITDPKVQAAMEALRDLEKP